MTDEEKKAIEMLKNYDNEDNLHKIHQSIDVVLNLIEKQQKEIETLNEKIKNYTIEDEKIFLQVGKILEKKRWQDKIKSKIEELKDGIYDAKIVLQKLLEE